MRFQLSPLCLLLSVAGAAHAQDQAFDVLSLQHLCSPQEAIAPPAWGTMLQQFDSGAPERQQDLLGANDTTIRFSTDAVVEMLRQLHRTALDEGRLHLDAVGENLVVFGQATEVAKVRKELLVAKDVLCRPVQIQLDVWDATDRETPASVLNAADYQRFTTNRTLLWRATATTQPGVPISLSRQRWTRYVRCVNVEVAMKQTISNPTTDNFGEGGHAVVRPMALLGDEFALHAQFVVAQRRGVVRALQTGMVGAAEIELPTLETCYGACSARVPNGGAMAITLRGHPTLGGQFVLTFRVQSQTPPATSSIAGLGIFPVGALTSLALQLRLRPPAPLFEGLPEPLAEGQGSLPAEQLLNLVRVAHAAELEAEGASANEAGGYLFVRCSPDGLQRVGATLQRLQDQLVQNAHLQHVGLLTPGDASSPATPQALHEISLPTLLGRQVTAARVLESPIVSDIWSEIAAEASTLAPQVTTLQAGTWIRGCLTRVADHAHLQLFVQCTHAPIPSARTLMPGGVMMPAEIATTRCSHDAVLANKEVIEHGDGPAVTLDGRGYRCALSTVLRW